MSVKSKRMRVGWRGLLSCVAVLVCTAALPGSAATYYVNGASGNDSNAGSSASPWKTIQKAANTLVAGDTALVAAGTYSERVGTSRSGTSGNQITIKSSGTVVMKGFDVNHSYITVDGFEITSTGQSTSVNVTGSYCQILNNNIHDTGGGTTSEINLTSSSANCLVKGNHIWGSQAYGNDHPCITLRGVNHLATGNEIGPILDGDAFRPFGSGHVMSSNYVHDLTLSPGSAAHMDVFQTFGDNGDSAYNIVFENNLVQNTDSQLFMTSVDGQNIHDFDVRNNVYINVNLQGNIGMPNFRFYNNVLYNVDVDNGVCLILYNKTWGVANNCKIKNNIFIGPGGLNYSAGVPYIFADNNDNWLSTPAADGLTGVETDYNYVTGNPSSGYPAMGNFSEAHGINGGNPKFANLAAWDFHLTQGSPAIDKGVTVTNFNYDRDGVTRPQGAAWDIGAYEFGVVNTNPPVLSSIQAKALSATSAQATWSTDKPATSTVQYGLSTSYGSTANDSTLVTNHSVALTGLSANTTYHCRVQSSDASGNTSSFSSDLSFTTPAPDTIPPTVSLTAPTATMLAGLVTLAATASDNVAVAGVQFLVDGQAVGAEVAAPPYSYAWNAYSVTNGTHTIQARARDASGNTALSLPAASIRVMNPVPSGLVGFWPFNEGSGTQTADLSGQAETVTLNGAGWGAGKLGAASLSLNGAGGSASAADAPALRLSGDMTIALWVKHAALPASGSWMYYVEKGLNNSENYALGAYSDATGTRLFFEFVDSTGASQYYAQGTGTALSAGAWTHVAAVFNHSLGQLQFFIGGQLVKSSALAQSLKSTTDPLVIGQQNITGYEFWMNGLLDDLRLYNRALTAAEVQSLAGPLPPMGLKVTGP